MSGFNDDKSGGTQGWTAMKDARPDVRLHPSPPKQVVAPLSGLYAGIPDFSA